MTFVYIFVWNECDVYFQMRIPIRNDNDLKTAVDLVDKNEKITSLRIFLTLPSNVGHGGGQGHSKHPAARGAGPSSTADSAYGSQVGSQLSYLTDQFMMIFIRTCLIDH